MIEFLIVGAVAFTIGFMGAAIVIRFLDGYVTFSDFKEILKLSCVVAVISVLSFAVASPIKDYFSPEPAQPVIERIHLEDSQNPKTIIFWKPTPAPAEGEKMFVTYSCDEEVLVTTLRNEPKFKQEYFEHGGRCRDIHDYDREVHKSVAIEVSKRIHTRR